MCYAALVDAGENRGRGLTEDELLKAAYAFARLIPTPPRLSRHGFLSYDGEIDEHCLRTWWDRQAEALRTAMRPSKFEPEDMNLGRYGQGGFPESFEEWLKKFDEWFNETPEISEEDRVSNKIFLVNY